MIPFSEFPFWWRWPGRPRAEKPDLLREPVQQQAAVEAHPALGPVDWPRVRDPYGPDRIVFGPGPGGRPS